MPAILRAIRADITTLAVDAIVSKDARVIAFPCISTGVYGFPIQQATGIAVRTVSAFLSNAMPIAEVIFCCFSDEDLALYVKQLATLERCVADR